MNDRAEQKMWFMARLSPSAIAASLLTWPGVNSPVKPPGQDGQHEVQQRNHGALTLGDSFG
jgi:hypothetical protein